MHGSLCPNHQQRLVISSEWMNAFFFWRNDQAGRQASLLTTNNASLFRQDKMLIFSGEIIRRRAGNFSQRPQCLYSFCEKSSALWSLQQDALTFFWRDDEGAQASVLTTSASLLLQRRKLTSFWRSNEAHWQLPSAIFASSYPQKKIRCLIISLNNCLFFLKR